MIRVPAYYTTWLFILLMPACLLKQMINGAVGIDFKHSIGDDHLSNIVESVGGCAVFLDYDKDGNLDIYLSNGTFAEGLSEGEKPGKLAENHLYRNQGDGTIKNITGTASLAQWISLI